MLSKCMRALVIILIMAASHAQAEVVRKPVICGSTADIFRTIDEEFHERPVWYTTNEITDMQITLTENSETRTWTLVEFDKEVACVLATGVERTIQASRTRSQYEP